MIAIQPKSRQILGVNQQAYQALKASMSLNLRRQLLVAVCDNVTLQNQLATQLENDLAQVNWMPSQESSANGSRANGSRASSAGASSITGKGSVALERLMFDPEDAHLPRQVAQWVRQTVLAEGTLPQLQVLGIEQMTRQPAIVQNHFLRSLEQVEALLPRLNTSLLVWVPWPWLRTIQSSSPTFWKWRNGVFEFVSDPTPALLESGSRDLEQRSLSASLPQNRSLEVDGDRLAKEMDSLSTGNRKPAPTPAEDYPHIEPHQVVALYGETDDSEINDDGQPTLETIATWDTVDVVATTVQSSLPEDEEAATSAETAAPLDTTAPPPKTPSKMLMETQLPKIQRSGASESPIARVQAPNKSAPNASDPTELEVQDASANEHPVKTDVDTDPVDTTLLEPTLPELVQEEHIVVQMQQSENLAEPEEALAPSQSHSQRQQRQSAADDYFEVGRRYRSRIEAGERGLDLIEPAIAAYEGALRCLNGPHPDWSSGLNDLGTLYWLKAQQLQDQQQVIDCMNHSVQLYSDALLKIDAEQSPDMAGQLYSNLGAVFSMLAMRQSPVAHFEKAAEAYLKALPLCPKSVDPLEFATLQNSLGSVYWKLSHYEQDEGQLQRYLQQAIEAYEQALSSYPPEQRPLDYAAVQNNLGITHWSLAKHQDAVPALKNAIAAYRDALNYRTPSTDAAACAITYNNLALAYWDLSKDDTVDAEPKRRHQRNAITAFEAALQTANGVGVLSKMDSAAIYHCLGDVHAQMVDGAPSVADITDSLQKSLHSYVQAIDAVPMDSPVFQARLAAIVANLRSHREHIGIVAQQNALNRVPSHLVSLVMQSL
ncbi:MAG: tetratricopeptide repeat protein [Cyanobacteria bacterium P01_D01_bin.36]